MSPFTMLPTRARWLALSVFTLLGVLPVAYGLFADTGVRLLTDEAAQGILGRCHRFLINDYNGGMNLVGWTFAEYVAFRIRHVLSLLALGIVAAHLIVAGILFREALWAFLNRWFREPGTATNLAVFRIIFYGLLPTLGLMEDAIERAPFPSEMMVPPPGWAWVFQLVPIEPTTVYALAWVALLAGGLAALGLWTRAAQFICLLASFYVLMVYNAFGKIEHFHHLIWFQIILLCSPCADVLSIDAAIGRKAPPSPSIRYGLPIKLIWVLFGTIYFFPGFWKWRVGGWDWAVGNNLVNILHNRWSDLGALPSFRSDQYPLMLWAGGLGVILFEMTFIFAIFHPVTRLLYAAGGIAFHLGAGLQLQIFFFPLLMCYPVLIDWSAGLFRARAVPSSAELQPERFPRVLAATGLALIVGNVAFGMMHKTKYWPLACYPTFAFMQLPTKLETFVEVDFADGRRERFNELQTAALLHIPPREWLRGLEGVRGKSRPDRTTERQSAYLRVVRLRLSGFGVQEVRLLHERVPIDLKALEKEPRPPR